MNPYGTWPSPFSASALASQSIGLGSVTIDGADIYWLEVRPQEGGRTVIVRAAPGAEALDVTAAGTNVRTRVHEYGGGAYRVRDGEVYYVNFADQRVYRQRGSGPATALTPDDRTRYADFDIDARRRVLFCVREDHRGQGEAVNTIVALPMDDDEPRAARVLASGHDFYSTPRLSPDGQMLAWLAWRHPNMPWDGTELWVATLGEDGALERPHHVAGGNAESIFQPGWSPDGTLYFVSDRDGWWRFYRLTAASLARPSGVLPPEPVLAAPPPRTEFARPQWGLGMRLWSLLGPSTIVATFVREGHSGVALIDVAKGRYDEVATDLEPLDDIAVSGGDVVFVAGSATRLPALVRLSLESGTVTTLRASSTIEIDSEYVSRPEAIGFPTEGGLTAHAFYYPPRNPACAAPPSERPPLIVIIHGGPTDAAKPTLRLSTQYWTSRGFALVDVDYGGSTGFGRAYRERLNGQWGVTDVADCVNAAKYLVEQGKADPNRLIIRGGSAGGYTTLAALAFHPGVFKAGASHYGICDLEILAGDTHKFESRYTDNLIGPYPAARDVYRARSPIHAVDRLASPLILFHGAEDKAVPPNQARMMADALRAKGLPVGLLIFEGEQHGFRMASSVIRALEAELWFYGAVFGFTPADRIEPVDGVKLRND